MSGKGLRWREPAALLVLLSILLFLPLGLARIAVAHWGELAWRHPLDLSFLEWTGAFLQSFLFLLLIEQCRRERQWRHAWLAASFLGMAGMNFAYALSGPGSETASWLRLLGMTLGGIYACGCLFCREERSLRSVPVAMIRLLLPLAMVMAVLLWIPHGLAQLLPHLTMTVGERMTLFGRIAVLLPGTLLFAAMLPWLRAYLKKWRGEDLLFTVVLLGLAQAMLLWRDAQSFGVLWWGSHLATLLVSALAAFLLLITSVRHSVAWKLIFSLGLTFGLTVILTAGLLQAHAQRRIAETAREQAHARHRLLLAEHSMEMQTACHSLDDLGQMATRELKRRSGGMPADGMPAWLADAITSDITAWGDRFPANGYLSLHNGVFPKTADPGEGKVGAELLAELAVKLAKATDSQGFCSSVRRDRGSPSGIILFAQPLLVHGEPVGCFFKGVGVDWLWQAGISAEKGYDWTREGRIMFELRSGEVLYRQLPLADGKAELESTPELEDESPVATADIERGLLATAYGAGPDGAAFAVSLPGKSALASAARLPGTELMLIHLLEAKALPGNDGEGGATYYFVGVGMAALLVGFAMLLLLLNFQLAKPLQLLLRATERVELGELSTRIDSRDTTEFGVVSRSFDHMLTRMEAAHEELERTVAERTTALAEVQQANQAKATFFASVSHELRTPLHGILSCSRLGVELTGSSLPKAGEYFDNINLSGRRLLKLIDEILDLAKIESGFMEFNYQTISLFPLAQQAIAEMAALFAEKKIKVECLVPNEPLRVVADVDMLRRVFVNLFGNAVKFSRPGTTIKVEFSCTAESISTMILDEGPGIPESEQDRIFEKFFQGRQGQAPGGTGIGLATCREIITAHGGTIRAENRIGGGGAAFIFTLPTPN